MFEAVLPTSGASCSAVPALRFQADEIERRSAIRELCRKLHAPSLRDRQTSEVAPTRALLRSSDGGCARTSSFGNWLLAFGLGRRLCRRISCEARSAKSSNPLNRCVPCFVVFLCSLGLVGIALFVGHCDLSPALHTLFMCRRRLREGRSSVADRSGAHERRAPGGCDHSAVHVHLAAMSP
jgi:hypothetical protein